MASTQKVAQWVGYFSEVFGRPITEATIEAFIVGLADVHDDALERGGVQCLRMSKFMPSIAELRENCGVTSVADRAVLAWDAVLKHLRIGPYEHVSFDDGVINATIRNMGGWPEFYGKFTGTEAEMSARKTFIETYRSLSHAGIDGDACRPLMGLSTSPDKKPLTIVTGLPQAPQPLAIGGRLPKLTLRKA